MFDRSTSPAAEMMSRRERWMARRQAANPATAKPIQDDQSLAKPIRYNDPKGGYQQPGIREGEPMPSVDPRTGSVRAQQMFPNGISPAQAMQQRRAGSTADAIRQLREMNRPTSAAALMARRRQPV